MASLSEVILATRPFRYFPLGDRTGSGTAVANLAQWYINNGARANSPQLGHPALNASRRTSTRFVAASSHVIDTFNAVIGGVAATDDFTICCWFKTSTAGRAIYCQGNSADADVLFEFVPNGANTGMTFQVRNTVATLLAVTEGAGSPTRADGKQHFGVALRKGARLEVWLDGKRVALSTTWAPAGTYNYDRTVIGRRESVANNYYDGWVQDVGLWRRALASAEHQEIWLVGVGAPRSRRALTG